MLIAGRETEGIGTAQFAFRDPGRESQEGPARPIRAYRAAPNRPVPIRNTSVIFLRTG